jgi:alpha-tubulin suppressor-like RCC1 family protein
VATGVGYCWGRDQHGQAGNGEGTATAPTEVAGPAHWSLIDANGNGMTCGLDGTGAAWCWGVGYLGIPSADPTDVPVAVDTELRFDALGTFYNGGCGLVEGAAYCWGENTLGTVGDASTTDAVTPVPLSTGESFVHLAVGGAHACALTSDLRAFCWGDNERGEAGSPPGAECGTSGCIRRPTAVTGGHAFLGLSAGDGLTCGVTSGGAGYCWGAGEAGQLGTGELDRSSTPVRVRHPSTGD